ncbi:MAG: LPXTG cell wall anchor domain-containing protein [Streptococcus sp.]|nr:LPXTG cell wall anchor domain-containing protein [Streptococcus sp.]
MIQKEGHGFFRKKKWIKGLASGVIVSGIIAFSSGAVLADENTNTTSIVTQTQETVSTYQNLKEAISNAEATGVVVNQTTTQTVASKAAADIDYKKQAEEIDAVTKQQEVINQANAQIADNNAALKTAQQDATSAAQATNQSVVQAQTDYPNATVTEKSIHYGDGTSVTDYQSGKSQVDDVSKANQTAISEYVAKKAEVDEHNAKVKQQEDNLKKNNIASDQANGLYVTGEFDKNAKGLAYYQTIKVVTTDSVAKAVKNLGWKDDTTITNANGVTITPHDTTNDKSINGTSSNFLYKITDATVGDSFKLNNIGTTTDGTNVNALVIITKASSLTDKETSWFLIGKTKDNGVAIDYWNYDSLGLKFKFVDDNDKFLKLVVASVIGDVDNDQTSHIEFEKNTLNYINPEGSGLIANANKSLTGLGIAVDGYQNAPLGTYLMVGSSDTINYTHTSDPGVINASGNIVNYIEFNLFGTSSLVETQEFRYLPDPELQLATVTLPPEAVLTPLRENLKVEYHLNEYKEPTKQTVTTIPVKAASMLPMTGEKSNWCLSLIGIGTLGVLTTFRFKWKKEI